MQVTSTFWAATQQLPRGERDTIPHMKEEMQGFHMNPISEIFICEKALFSALSQSKGAAPPTLGRRRRERTDARMSLNLRVKR